MERERVPEVLEEIGEGSFDPQRLAYAINSLVDPKTAVDLAIRQLDNNCKSFFAW